MQVNPGLRQDDVNFHIGNGLLPEFHNLEHHDIHISDLTNDILTTQVQNFEDLEIVDELAVEEDDRAQDFQLDFGDLNRRSSSVRNTQSRLLTPLAQLSLFELGDFDLQEPVIEPTPAEVIRKPEQITKKSRRIQVDSTTMLSTQNLRDLDREYIQNQVFAIGVKFAKQIADLEPEYYHYQDWGSFQKYMEMKEFRFRLELEDVHVNVTRGRERSSSMLSIERARRLSRSRSNSEVSQLQMELNDFLQFESNIEPDVQQEFQQHSESIWQRDTVFITYLQDLKAELMRNHQLAQLNFSHLIQRDELRSNVVRIFTRVLECANENYCDLKQEEKDFIILIH